MGRNIAGMVRGNTYMMRRGIAIEQRYKKTPETHRRLMLLMASRVDEAIGAFLLARRGRWAASAAPPPHPHPPRVVPAKPSCFMMFCAVSTMPPPDLPESCIRT